MAFSEPFCLHSDALIVFNGGVLQQAGPNLHFSAASCFTLPHRTHCLL